MIVIKHEFQFTQTAGIIVINFSRLVLAGRHYTKRTSKVSESLGEGGGGEGHLDIVQIKANLGCSQGCSTNIVVIHEITD